MAKLMVITGPGAALGFRLGGFEVSEMADDGEIDSLIEEISAEGGYGLLCVEERFHKKISDRVMRRVRKKGLPVVLGIEIPEKWEETEAGESHIARLIRRAIGYQVKIKK